MFLIISVFSVFTVIAAPLYAQNMAVPQVPYSESNSEAVPTIIEAPTAKAKPQSYPGVRLQGLDKVTARRQRFDATMGVVTRFGNLEVIPRACWRAPAGERPETAALLEVWHWKQSETPTPLFKGWMFASSPALSSLEHPVYDLTVLDCLEDEKEEAKPEEATAENKPEEPKNSP